MQDLSEQALIHQANLGHKEAFHELYQRHEAWVFSVAMRYLKNEEDALDVQQDTFIYFFQKFPGFELICQLRTFLYPAIRNLSFNLKKKRRQHLELESVSEELISLDHVDPKHERAEFLKLTASLSSQHQEVLLLRYADDFDLKEIAQILEIPQGTVKSRIFNALASLKKKIKKD